jgi:hypothetical protein
MKFLKPLVLGYLLNTWLIAITLLIAGFHWKLALAVVLAAPTLTLIALPFAKWDVLPSFDSNGQGLTIRGDLPAWAWWLSTPDERLPGGTYEPTVAIILDRYGPFLCSWYWLGWRNIFQGLAASFGVPTSTPWSPAPGFYSNGLLWWLRYPLLGNLLQLKAGWRTYDTKGTFLAVPCLTVTKP